MNFFESSKSFQSITKTIEKNVINQLMSRLACKNKLSPSEANLRQLCAKIARLLGL